MNIPFFELRDFPTGSDGAAKSAVLEVWDSKFYVLGPYYHRFCEDFAQFHEAQYCIGTSSGYHALLIALMSLNLRPGDEVILPANTYIACVNAVLHAGAQPVLVDVHPDTYLLNPETLPLYVTDRTRVIMAVHLFGQCCDMESILKLAGERGIVVMEDFAQAHGASRNGKKAGTLGDISATSFYPTKNLGTIGDGGAILFKNQDTFEFARRFHNYGGVRPYFYEQVGVNSRLDEVKAADLSSKLPFLRAKNSERQRLARRYDVAFKEIEEVLAPKITAGNNHVYYTYVVQTARRDELQDFLEESGIRTQIHYPVPCHLQPSMAPLGYQPGEFPVTELFSRTMLSLPLFPGMHDDEQDYVISEIIRFFT